MSRVTSMWRAMGCVALFLAAALATAAVARAADAPVTNTAARVAAFAQLPDWRGVWLLEGPAASFDPAGRPPPYTSAWAAQLAAARTAKPERDTLLTQCMAGVPRLAATPSPFVIMATPEETLIHYARREVRHIWTDGRAHPPADEMWPFTWADSIGHWEGQVLVIDTVSNNGKLWIDAAGARLSDKAHITERLSMPAPGRLRDELLIEDPLALAQPWKVVRTYRRTASAELPEEQCDWKAGVTSAGR